MRALEHLKEAERIILDFEPDEKMFLDALHDAKIAIWMAMGLHAEAVN